MPNDEKDRHVAAAAVKGGAQVIATANLRHFAQLPDGIEAQGPDALDEAFRVEVEEVAQERFWPSRPRT
jgi:hypothetical protein